MLVQLHRNLYDNPVVAQLYSLDALNQLLVSVPDHDLTHASGSSLLSLAINSAVVMDTLASPTEPVMIRRVIPRAYQP